MIRPAYSVLIIVLCFFSLTGCKYQKGDKYTYSPSDGNSMNYLIRASGKGHHLSKKAAELKQFHLQRGDSCQLKYLSDSAMLSNQRSILLVHTVLPDVKDDILTEGFFGTFVTRQNVYYVLVSDEEFEKYFQAPIKD